VGDQILNVPACDGRARFTRTAATGAFYLHKNYTEFAPWNL